MLEIIYNLFHTFCIRYIIQNEQDIHQIPADINYIWYNNSQTKYQYLLVIPRDSPVPAFLIVPNLIHKKFKKIVTYQWDMIIFQVYNMNKENSIPK